MGIAAARGVADAGSFAAPALPGDVARGLEDAGLGPAFTRAPRPDGLVFARGLGLRVAVADFGAPGAPIAGAPTDSGAFDGGGTVVSSSSRRMRPAIPAPAPTALRPRSVAVSISFFGNDGIGA